MKKKTASYWLFLLPSLLGVLVFYVVPFGYSLYYALIDNMGSQEFVGLKNFSDTLTNSLFQSAAFNSAVFMVISVPLGMALALVLSLCLQKMKTGPGGRHHGAPAAPGSPLGDHRVLLESAVRLQRPGK